MTARGRPPRAWRWLVHDVDCVRLDRHCSVLEACGYLADGEFAETLPVVIPSYIVVRSNGRVVLGEARVVWGKWKGMDIRTLERKYYLQKRKQAEAQKNDLTKFRPLF